MAARNARRSTTRTKRKSRKQKRTNSFYFWGFATIAIVVGIVAITSNIVSTADAFSYSDIPITATAKGTLWWNQTFHSRQKLDISNTDSTTKLYTFNHKNLVNQGLSLADGSDINVVAQVADKFDPIAIEIDNLNTKQTEIIFDVSRYPQADYYIYYGSAVPSTAKVLGTVKLSKTAAIAITAGEVEHPDAHIKMDESWVLKRAGDTVLSLDLELAEEVGTAKKYSYLLNGSVDPVTVTPNQTDGFEISLGDLDSGHYDLSLIIETNTQKYLSNSVAFTVSAPMYVAMTIDWEGRGGEQDWVLDELGKLSRKYNMPYTHFFNPRIYIANQIDDYRAKQLTDWVVNRHNNKGDEIALHLHMFYDMIEAAGVEAKQNPRWGSGIDGYDVLASGYNYQEFTKILNWSLEQFELNGLPKPVGFRTGGWFADLDILKAVDDAGFTYDSSGRDRYKFGSNQVEGHWNLDYTTQPYYPSTADQNSTNSSSTLNLLEIPNNGNDAYWFDTDQLLQRFYANYSPNQLLDEPKIVTFLTHPDWFGTDLPRIQELLEEINQFTVEQGGGPVVFTTLADTLPEWQ